jgi:hypothetical protein
MKQKLFTLFLALATSVGTIFAESGSCGENLTWNLTNGVLTISGSGTMSNYEYMYSPWAGYRENITQVIIGSGVTSIGEYAFCRCSNLTSVTIPNSVTCITHGAFGECTSLASIELPNGVTSIGQWAFGNCNNLTSITIPNSVTSIGVSAFSGCTGLTSPVYNNHIFAYMPPSYVGAYTIPNGIESIAGGAFYGCTGLTSVSIPNSVTSIGDDVFSGCSGLTSVTIPNSVTGIGDWAFNNCTDLTAPVYNAHVFAYMPPSYVGAYTIPNGIESIAGGAFYGCTSLTSITIPNSVTSIGDGAFKNCTGLTSVICLGEVPPTMGDKVFFYQDPQDGLFLPLPNISSIYVPCGTLNTYKSSWHQHANLIRYESIPYTIEAYAKNPNMGSIDYPQGNLTVCDNPAIVTAIPNRGFYFVQWADGNTDNPRTIELTQDTTMEAIFDYLLDGKCGKDSVLTWKLDTSKMALTITGNGALSENYTYGKFIESVAIGNEITSIGNYAFGYYNNLKNVTLGSSVKVLEESAFYYCSAIETITCYSQRPPTVNNYALYRLDYSTIVYVPADYLNTYKMHDTWGLYDVRPIGAKSTETTEVTVTPSETTAEVTWPAIEGAATYELVIKDKNGNTICTLVFNANGQLTQIAFNAPSRDHAPQQTQSTGFAFTVTGLEQGTGYDLTITAKDNNGSALDTQTVSFNTNWPEGIETTNDQTSITNKVIKDGQIYILRGDKTYNLQGQLVNQ